MAQQHRPTSIKRPGTAKKKQTSMRCRRRCKVGNARGPCLYILGYYMRIVYSSVHTTIRLQCTKIGWRGCRRNARPSNKIAYRRSDALHTLHGNQNKLLRLRLRTYALLVATSEAEANHARQAPHGRLGRTAQCGTDEDHQMSISSLAVCKYCISITASCTINQLYDSSLLYPAMVG